MNLRQGGLKGVNLHIESEAYFRVIWFAGKQYIFTTMHRVWSCLFLCLIFYSETTFALVSEDDKESFLPYAYLAHPFPMEVRQQNIILLELDNLNAIYSRVYSSKAFDPESGAGLIGYFEPESQYRYHSQKNYFETDDTLQKGDVDAWDGQFLNWLAMKQIDMLRYQLLGSDASTKYIKLSPRFAASERFDLRNSSTYSPIPSGEIFSLKHGRIEHKGKQYHLQIKGVRPEKGLLSILRPAASVYFFTEELLKGNQTFIFGDEDELVNHLLSLEQREPQTAVSTSTKLLPKALEQIRKITKGTSKDKALANVCQRYAHIKITVTSETAPIHSLGSADCQPEIEGDQALESFYWSLLMPSSELSDQILKKQFFVDGRYALAKNVFKFLSSDIERPFQLSGVDSEYFPDGTGILYQALSRYAMKNSHEEVNWAGDLVAIFIDKLGRLRSDNGDRKLGSIKEDPVISACFDKKEATQRYRFQPEQSVTENCNALNYPYLEEDVGFLWRASDSLGFSSQNGIVQQRKGFLSPAPERFIRTHIGQEEYDFIDDEIDYPIKPEWLNARSESEAKKIINYIRGQDQKGARNRRIGGMSYLLGDTAHSAPIVVGRPKSNYHLLYGDQSYQKFLQQYQHRASRVFLSANDGMIHSFNAGVFDDQSRQVKSTNRRENNMHLGQETWAFVPFSVLPYLKALRATTYGISRHHHLNLLTQTPYIFDARIFGPNGVSGQADRLFEGDKGFGTHPEGWGTVMVVGMGLGGGKPKTLDSHDMRKDSAMFAPAYLVFDITDAEQPPKFLASLSAENMGTSSSLPSAVTLRNDQGELEWYLAFGSGYELGPNAMLTGEASNKAKVFLVNLHKLQNKQSSGQFRALELNQARSAVTGITSADWDLDGASDAIYVNATSQQCHSLRAGNCKASIFRLHVDGSAGPSKMHTEKLIDVGAPLIQRPLLSLDGLGNRWIYASSGQPLYMRFDKSARNNRIIGIKEPRDSLGRYRVEMSTGRSGTIRRSELVDVSHVRVDPQLGNLTGSLNIKPSLDQKNVLALEQRLMAYSDSSRYLHGWQKNFSNNELANNQANLMGGLISQSTYQPSYQNCRILGKAYIHRLRFTTGTPWFNAEFDSSKAKSNPIWIDTQSDILGSEPLTGLLLNMHESHTQLMHAAKDGRIASDKESERHIEKSGEISWRAL